MAGLPLEGDCVRLAFSEDGSILVTAPILDGELTLWRVPEGTKVVGWPVRAGHLPRMPGFAVNRDCTVAAVAVRRLSLMDLSTGKERWSAKTDNDFFTRLAFSPDGKVLVSAEGLVHSVVRFWEVATGKEIGAPLKDHRGWVGGLLFFPDGKIFAAPSRMGYVRLWQTATWRGVRTLRGVLLNFESAVFSPDSARLIADSGGEEAVKFWDMESYEELLTLSGRGFLFSQTTFSPDGNVVGSHNQQGMLHLWRAPSWAEIDARNRRRR